MGFPPRSLFALALASAVLAVPAARQQSTQQQAPPATFKAGTRIVPLYVTVTDAQRRLVPGLAREDFEVFDQKQPQPITVFDSEVRPISVVVMLDTSASMTGSIRLLQEAAEQFLLRLLPADKAVVGAFNDKIQFVVDDFTGDRDHLVASLRDIDFGNPTRLWDAIDASFDQLHGIDGRRVVLVFTDGFDERSTGTTLNDVLARGQSDEVMVYAIGLRSDYFNGRQRVRSRPDSSLRRVSEETGGGYFELEKTAELASTFTRVAQELHSQYLIGFTPATLDGKVHRVEVRVKKTGMQARARRSYLASASAPGTAPAGKP